jgi:hypothetical protein
LVVEGPAPLVRRIRRNPSGRPGIGEGNFVRSADEGRLDKFAQ